MNESLDTLKIELLDEEYRYAYAEDFLNTFVAMQIKALREQRKMTQEDFAKKIGTKQPGASRLENVNHSSWKTETLKKVARALDVRLRVSFEPFSTLIEDARTFSRGNLERVRFSEDPMFARLEALPRIEMGAQQNAQALSGPLFEAPQGAATAAA